MQQGQFQCNEDSFNQKGNVIATVWRDKRDVVMIPSGGTREMSLYYADY